MEAGVRKASSAIQMAFHSPFEHFIMSSASQDSPSQLRDQCIEMESASDQISRSHQQDNVHPTPSIQERMSLELVRYSNMQYGLMQHILAIFQTDILPWQDENDIYKTFTEKNFKQRECCRFIPRRDQKVKQRIDLKCSCGEILSGHYFYRVQDKKQQHMSDEVRQIMRRKKWKNPPPANISCLDDEWNPDYIENLPSSSFGKINFVNMDHTGEKKLAKFIRLSNEDCVYKTLELMEKHWRMMDPNPPHLVISVVGGSENFKFNGKIRETFCKGLITASKTTDAWLITSGLDVGVIKSVGQAVQQEQSYLWDDGVAQCLKCIGIAPWGFVKDRHELEGASKKRNKTVDIKSSNEIERGKPLPLNPDHTHFIFVDDGYRNRNDGIAKFKANLEKAIAAPKTEKGLEVPLVMVVVEGGPETINEILQSLKHGIPVVICAGTGLAADILAYAYSKKKPNEDIQERKLEKKISYVFKSFKINEAPDQFHKVLENVKKCCEKKELITIVDMNKQEDLHRSIFLALLYAHSSNPSSTESHRESMRLEQLRLALAWNRVDIAQEKIFLENVQWSPGSLNDIMTEAIRDDKAEFARLLIEKGFIMKDYLTEARLEELYKTSPRQKLMERVFSKLIGEKSLSIDHLPKLLTKLLGNYERELTKENSHGDIYDENNHEDSEDENNHEDMEDENNHADMEYENKHENMEYENIHEDIEDENTKESMDDDKERKSEDRLSRPYKELFIWALLYDRQALAKLFLEMGEEPVTSAIAATRIYDSLSHACSGLETHLRKKLNDYKSEYENLAIRVLDGCHSDNPDMAMILVERKSPTWDSITCMEMAASANDQKFISSATCQNSIESTWRNGIQSHWILVVLSVLLPPLITTINTTPRSDALPRRALSHMSILWLSSIFKFSLSALFYLFFNIFFTSFIMMDFKAYEMTITEKYCMWFICGYIVDEVINMICLKKARKWRDIMKWYGILKILELLNYILAVIGFVIHCTFPKDYMMVKAIYSVNCVIFYVGFTKYCIASARLGPKLVMLKRMVDDLVLFLLVLVIFLIGYGVARESLLYTYRENGLEAFKDVFYYPYWQLFGELYLEESTQTDEACIRSYFNSTNSTDGITTCRTAYWLVKVLLAFYLIVGQLLLISLIIAIFSHVFKTVEQNSQTIWKLQMYFLSMEYRCKTTVPSPFSIAEHAVRLLYWVFIRIKRRGTNEILTIDEVYERTMFDKFKQYSDAERTMFDKFKRYSDAVQYTLLSERKMMANMIQSPWRWNQRNQESYNLNRCEFT